MHHIKRYDLLIRAFGMISDEFPDWQLRIYGDGGEAAKLRGLVTELGLTGRALLMGGFSPIESEWVKGSIAAVTSSAESFGMTLVEAMRCGLPVVSTDCPVGPREILRDGEDGLLVPTGDAPAIASGLRLPWPTATCAGPWGRPHCATPPATTRRWWPPATSNSSRTRPPAGPPRSATTAGPRHRTRAPRRRRPFRPSP